MPIRQIVYRKLRPMTKVTLEQLLSHSKLKTNDSEALAEHLAGMSKVKILLNKKDFIVSEKITKEFKSAEREILNGFPIQYVLGTCNFYGREFIVNRNVLIPRPETEILVQEASKFIKSKVHKVKTINIIDIGTGSGCIAISLFKELNKLFTPSPLLPAKRTTSCYRMEHKVRGHAFHFSLFTILATDISPPALYVARKNAQKHHARIKFLKSDLFSNSKLPKKFDLILANLPYLPSDYLLENDALKHEPRLALDGEEDGMEIIEELIDILPKKLNQNALAILEIDPRQKLKIQKHLKNFSKLKFLFKEDLNTKTRFLLLGKNSLFNY